MGSFKFTRTRLAALVAVTALALGASVGVAVAAFPDTNVDTYTGCLNVGGTNGGTFVNIALGGSPAKACGSNQKLVHLSGGDITKVSAGAGLTATPAAGDNGAITLSLDGAHSLPQGCTSGQVAKSDGSNAWNCSNDNDTTYSAGTGLDLSSSNVFSVNPSYRIPGKLCSTAGEFATGFDSSGAIQCAAPSSGGNVFASAQPAGGLGIPSDAGFHDVLSLNVPAGTFAITAIGTGQQDSSREWEMECDLVAGSTDLSYGGTARDNPDAPLAESVTLAMMAVHTFTGSAVLTVRCRTGFDGVAVRHFGLQATRVG